MPIQQHIQLLCLGLNCNHWIIALSGKARIGGDLGIGSLLVELVVPPVTGLLHGTGDLDETGNVGTGNQAGILALGGLDVLLGRVETLEEGALHDLLELAVNLLLGPGETLAVLGHLETGDGDTTAVGGLARGIPDGLALLLTALVLKDLDGLESAAHVGTLSNELAAGGDKSLGLLLADLVLGGRRESNVDLADVDPGTDTVNVLEVVLVAVVGERAAVELELSNGGDILGGDALLASGDERALGVGKRDDLAAELDDLEGSILGDVAGARDGDALVLPAIGHTSILEHVADIVDEAETSGLGTDERATPVETLAGKDTSELVALTAVGTEHVTDLAATNTDITSGNIGIGTNVSGELAHEGNAEAANLVVTLALGVEVGTTLATTHHHCCELVSECSPYRRQSCLSLTASEGILEDLLEAEELEDGKVDGGVKSETTLVWAEGRVELDTITTVHLEVAIVVLPDDAELDDTLGDGDDLEGGAVLGVLLEEGAVLEGVVELCRVHESARAIGGPVPQGLALMETHPCRPARTRAQKEGWTL